MQFIGISFLVPVLLSGSHSANAQTFIDISNQVTIAKSGLVLNRATNTFNTVVTVTNQSSAIINAPLVLQVSNIVPTSVILANATDQVSSTDPYINLPVPPNGLSPGASISNVLLAFNNPTRINFSFALTVAKVVIQPDPLPIGAIGPLISSVPPTGAVVGKSLEYQVFASSSVTPASITFSLSSAPTGMNIDPATGLLTWVPGTNQVGDQSVTIVATDSTGTNSQSFTLSVFGAQAKATATISAANGGVITVNDPLSSINGLSLTVPAGALTADTTVTISELTLPPTLGGTTHFWMRGFSIDPDVASLAVPATATIPYDPTQFGVNDGVPLESFLGVYFLQTSTGALQFVSTYSVDSTNHIVTTSLPHFSSWITTNAARLCPPPPGPPPLDCPNPNSYSPTKQSLVPPVVMVHGFQFANGGMGNENTWGNLRILLGKLDLGLEGRIDAWRFDWDSKTVPFENSAYLLKKAISFVESKQTRAPQPPFVSGSVNIVAHSFGGILVRTYLEDKALIVPYSNDVNRTLTLGTPHTGIGGKFSTAPANLCAAQAAFSRQSLPTCFEAGTGRCPQANGDPGACRSGEGQFLLDLNATALPPLHGTESPSYLHIKGNVLSSPLAGFGPPYSDDDGLITTRGAQLCGGSPIDVCNGADAKEQINSTISSASGLCHSAALFGTECALQPTQPTNVAMAEVTDTSHPLWQTICQFLGCAPAINVTLSDPAAGTVTSDIGNINCGSNCSAVYPSDLSSNPVTVTLTATANPGYTFTGWSGSGAGPCTTTQLTCQITIGNDYQSTSGPLFTGYAVSATFSSALCPAQMICGSVTDIVFPTYPLPGVLFEAFRADGSLAGSGGSDASGRFSFGGTNGTVLTDPGYRVTAIGPVAYCCLGASPGGPPLNIRMPAPAHVTVTAPVFGTVLFTPDNYVGPVPCYPGCHPIIATGVTTTPSNSGSNFTLNEGTVWISCYLSPNFTQTPSVQLTITPEQTGSIPCPQYPPGP
jgi:hypothetical protein